MAAFFDAGSIQILSRTMTPGEGDGNAPAIEQLEGRPLSPASMASQPTPNTLVQLYTDQRARLVEALMYPRVLVPEGRIDFEWLRLLLDVAETGERPLHGVQGAVPPFGSVVGVVPTRDSAVKVTFERLRTLHAHVAALVDGDPAGDGYVNDLLACDPPPCCVMQWPSGWAVENALRWTLDADAAVLLPEINSRLGRTYQSLDELVAALKNGDGRNGGLKAHYMAHEDIAGAMRRSVACVQRVEQLLEAVTRGVLGRFEGFGHLEMDESRSGNGVTVCRFRP